LEAEDLELLDAFIAKHPEYSNRSNFARVAIRSFIEQYDGDGKADTTKLGKKSNVIMVEVPGFAQKIIASAVRAGIFISPEDAVLDCVKKRFINTDEMIEKMRKQKSEDFETVQMISE
jgi:Arc/MetJ-type ribon-helix-helix transcriptional regulator